MWFLWILFIFPLYTNFFCSSFLVAYVFIFLFICRLYYFSSKSKRTKRSERRKKIKSLQILAMMMMIVAQTYLGCWSHSHFSPFRIVIYVSSKAILSWELNENGSENLWPDIDSNKKQAKILYENWNLQKYIVKVEKFYQENIFLSQFRSSLACFQ